MSDADVRGVVFPFAGERRSTTTAGRTIVADALRPVDPIGAQSAAGESAWRTAYVEHFRRLVVAGLGSAQDAVTIARAGLDSTYAHLAWAGQDGTEPSLAEALDAGSTRPSAAPARDLVTETQRGSGTPERTLEVPYKGARLEGSALRAQLDDWVTRGVVEPSVATAVGAVIDNPDWLDLADLKLVVLGAGAEMGPLRSVLRWGGDVLAVDVPRPDLWRRLLDETRRYAGWLHLPVRPGPEHAAERAGVNLVTEWPAVADWIASHEGPLVVGNYVYADGADNVRVSAACDALTHTVARARADTALAFLATPTDVFAVPGAAVSRSVAAYQHATISRAVRYPLRALSGGRLLTRNYVPGSDPGLNDSVVPQQGPNYLLAKRLQRWRATVARDEGTRVSLRVAPPTRTRSVVKKPCPRGGVCRCAPIRDRGVRARDLQHPHGCTSRPRPPHRASTVGSSVGARGARGRARWAVDGGIRPTERAGAGRDARSGVPLMTTKRESPRESKASLPVCGVCGALAGRADDPVVLTTWVRDRSGGRVTWTCAECSRRHVRDIEGKLDAQWW